MGVKGLPIKLQTGAGYKFRVAGKQSKIIQDSSSELSGAIVHYICKSFN